MRAKCFLTFIFILTVIFFIPFFFFPFYLFLSFFFARSLLSPLPPKCQAHTHTPCMSRALAFLKFHRINLVQIVEEFITRMSFEKLVPIESIYACKVLNSKVNFLPRMPQPRQRVKVLFGPKYVVIHLIIPKQVKIVVAYWVALASRLASKFSFKIESMLFFFPPLKGIP